MSSLDKLPEAFKAINSTALTSIRTSLAPIFRTLPEWRQAALPQYISQNRQVATTSTAFAGTFFTVFQSIMSLGFGSQGIMAGSIAAAHQSAWFGAVVPAGSYFATLTSMGALGTLAPAAAGTAALLAAPVAWVVWAGGYWGN